MEDLRSFALLLADLYISQSMIKIEEYEFIVLVITLLCICVTAFAGSFMIPALFVLDN